MNDLPYDVKQFFLERKITEKVLKDFSIGWNMIGIVYPVRDETGEHIFNNYRRNPSSTRGMKYWYDSGSKVSLYGVDKIKNEKSVLICEGMNDCLVAWSQGVPAVTSTGGAMSFQKEWVDFFIDEEGKDVTVCLDSDKAGQEGMVKIRKIIPWAKFLFLPEGVKDISEFTTKGGDLKELLKTSKEFIDLDSIRADRSARLAIFKTTFFHDKILIEAQPKPISKKVPSTVTDRVLRAKQYPITDILEFRQYKAICPFHNEKTPSLNYYPNDNHTYCFGGCGKAYDSIAIYQKLNNCSFKQAVDALQ